MGDARVVCRNDMGPEKTEQRLHLEILEIILFGQMFYVSRIFHSHLFQFQVFQRTFSRADNGV